MIVSAMPTTRSRASSVAPTYVSPARSASERPCSAVTRAARALAWAAERVCRAAVVRVRRPVDFDGVVAVVLRVVVVRRVVLRRVVLGLRADVRLEVLL